MSTLDAPPFDGDPSWRVHHVLADGTRVTLRPLFPEDRDELRRAFHETSPKTRYLRFLGVVGELSEEMLRYLTEVDQKDHVAIVATTTTDDLKEERGLGVARFIRVDGEPDVAEAAVTVVDAMQRRGVGTLLVRELAQAAKLRGIKRLRADVLEDNASMRAILDAAGAKPQTRSSGAGMIAYDVELDGHSGRTLSPTLLAILRGAAQTLAVTIRRFLPPDGPVVVESGATTADEDHAERGETEGEPGAT